MTNPSFLELARNIIYQHLGQEDRKCKSDTDNIFEDLGADGLDEIEIIMSLEEQFNIEIPDYDFETVEDFLKIFS